MVKESKTYESFPIYNDIAHYEVCGFNYFLPKTIKGTC